MIPISVKANSDRFIQHVSRILDCSDEQSTLFIEHVDKVVREVQGIFSQIASHTVRDRKKRALMNKTMKKHFEKPTSSIQVSSKNSGRIKVYAIKNYLVHLMNLSKHKYTKVKLIYSADYASMGRMYSYVDPVYGKVFEFKIAVWQFFTGENEDDLIFYSDATQKDMIFMFHQERASEYWTLKIKAILAKETISLDRFKQ